MVVGIPMAETGLSEMGEAMNLERNPQGDSKVNMRGWGRITVGSTKLSTMPKMRQAIAGWLKGLSDTEPIMWEIIVRVPPSKKRSKS
jgi:hypothetical protein